MRAAIRWTTELVELAAIGSGDLFFYEEGPRFVLAMAVGGLGATEAITLAEFGSSSGNSFPEIISLAMSVPHGRPVRRVDSGLVIEPTELQVVTILGGAPGPQANYGILVEMSDGRLAILVRRNAMPPTLFDIESGEVCDTREARGQRHWQLVWADGEDRIILCAF